MRGVTEPEHDEAGVQGRAALRDGLGRGPSSRRAVRADALGAVLRRSPRQALLEARHLLGDLRGRHHERDVEAP